MDKTIMRSKLRIVLGTLYPFDETQVRGGVEAVGKCLAQALAQYPDIDLHVVSCNRSALSDFHEKRGQITFHWIHSNKRFYGIRALTTNAWKVRRVYESIQPDVVHSQGFSEYALATRPNDRLLLTVHGVELFIPSLRNIAHFKGLTGIYRQWVVNRIISGSLKKSRAIISIAGPYIRQILGARLKDHPVYFVDNPVSDDFFNFNSSHFSVNPTVFSAGTIIERKNVVGLVRAFAQAVKKVPEAKLIIAGSVEEPLYYKKVLEEIANLNLQEKVILPGHMTQEQLLEAYASAAVFVLFSSHETTPVVIAQAMAMGKSVIASNVGGVSWMFEDGVSGLLVEVDDIEGFAEKLCEVLLNTERQRQIGLEGRRVALERYKTDKVASKTFQLYQELCIKG